MDGQLIQMEFPVKGGNFGGAGDAASKIKNILKQLGIRYEIIKRVAIASYEAEMNIVAHAAEGTIVVEINPNAVVVAAKDKGPGIPDIDLAMKEGFSTASQQIREMGFGAGMGLPNIKKATDDMTIKTEVGVGTELTFKIFLTDNREETLK